MFVTRERMVNTRANEITAWESNMKLNLTLIKPAKCAMLCVLRAPKIVFVIAILGSTGKSWLRLRCSTTCCLKKWRTICAHSVCTESAISGESALHRGFASHWRHIQRDKRRIQVCHRRVRRTVRALRRVRTAAKRHFARKRNATPYTLVHIHYSSLCSNYFTVITALLKLGARRRIQ